ncbi:HAD domain-containing protein [Paenibacillus turpanensis]|uniref:HAD domain-containing protein n=1 Tax=Paenibacillus turpanensis TaxID=2689078 RepID=UPI00140D0AC4|nr:HAD domain-containing protein [Paenibacillus turpanensis]
MRIIFLDIDGVINTVRNLQFQGAGADTRPDQIRLDPLPLLSLKEMIEVTNAYIVVTSSWRKKRETSRLWKVFMKAMEEAGLQSRVIGVTPELDKPEESAERWQEIQLWLEQNKRLKIKGIVILDDQESMGDYTKTHFVHCDPYDGLTKPLMKKAVQVLLSGQRLWD